MVESKNAGLVTSFNCMALYINSKSLKQVLHNIMELGTISDFTDTFLSMPLSRQFSLCYLHFYCTCFFFFFLPVI